MSELARRRESVAFSTRRPRAGEGSKRIAAISWMVLSLNLGHFPALVFRSFSTASETQMSAVALSLTLSALADAIKTTAQRNRKNITGDS